MFRKRQRFERSDVPRDSPYRVPVAIGVLVLLAIALVVVVRLTWDRAVADTKLGDVQYSQVINASHDAQSLPGSTTPEGYTFSQDGFTTALVFQSTAFLTDGTADPALQSAELISINDKTGTSALVQIPPSLTVSDHESGEAITLADLFVKKGRHAAARALVDALGIAPNAILVMPQNPLDLAHDLAHQSKAKLFRNAPSYLRGVRSNLKLNQLLDFARRLASLKQDKFTLFDLPLDSSTQGSELKADATQLGVLLGRLIKV